MITLDHVSKIYNAGKPGEFVALRDVSLRIERGGMTVLRGPSGSGKTTMLSLVGCMARPTSGRIHLDEREVTSLPERFLAELRLSRFGFIFQSFNLISGLSVLDNVMLPAAPLGEPRSDVARRAKDLLERFRIAHKARERVENLSGGERQRTAIARALLNGPDTIIADEPTAHLDTELAREFMTIATELAREGRTVIIASHDPVVSEHQAVSRVVGVRDGRVTD